MMKRILALLVLLPALAQAQYVGPIYKPSAVAITGGTITGTTISKVTITAPATSATLTIANGKTATVNNTLTLAGTDSTTMTFPTTSATMARTDAGQTFTGDSSVNGIWRVNGASNKGTVKIYGLTAATDGAWSVNSQATRTFAITDDFQGLDRVTVDANGRLNALYGASITGTMNASTAVTTGASTLTVAAGAIGMSKMTADGAAPGAGGGKLQLVCGTNAGTAKLVISAGTSATTITITDNIGAGVTGC